MEYCAAPIVADASSVDGWLAHIDRYAQMLAVLNEAALSWDSPKAFINTENRTANFYSVWQRWLGNNIQRVPQLETARKFVAEKMPDTTCIMQHGDLQPWQIFADGQEWVIYDGERSGTDLLQFNDVAYGYGRLWTKFHSSEVAKDLLKRFIQYSKIDDLEFMEHFQPVMVARSVGMLADAFHDCDDNDYIDDTKMLLELSLNNPEKLLK